MKLSSFNIAVMMLMLTIGIAAGAAMFRTVPNTKAAVDQHSMPTADVHASSAAATEPARQHTPVATYVGVIFARQSADIVARSEGTLQTVYVNLGDRLKAGDIIAETDPHSGNQQLQMAEATLLAAQAEQRNTELEVKDAEIRYRRRKELAEYGLVSQEDLMSAKIQADRAEAKLQADEARVAEQVARVNDAKDSLSNTVIRAPFEGTVAARYIDAGAATRLGTPIISLIRPEDLWVRFAVPESQQSRISVGSSVRLQLPGSSASVRATVEHLAPSITSTSQEILAEARLNVPVALREQIRPGSSGVISWTGR
jgi:macrolide-specific efflux system membrane fusion protein